MKLITVLLISLLVVGCEVDRVYLTDIAFSDEVCKNNGGMKYADFVQSRPKQYARRGTVTCSDGAKFERQEYKLEIHQR